MNRTSTFLEKPNLPSANVSLMIVSERAKELLETSLNKLCIEVFSLKASTHCDARVSDHPDMLICHIGGESFVITYEQDAEILYKQYGLLTIRTNVHIEKLKETSLNAVLLGNNFIHNMNHTAPELLSEVETKKYCKVHVKQGYTKCSVCIVNQNAIITEDNAIHIAAKDAGIESLLIQKEHVILEGFPYGFIGGATGMISPKKLALTGRIDLHPDRDSILRYLKSFEVEPLFLTEQPIFDVGSLLPVKEYSEGR